MIGVLVEVPVMLSLVAFANRSRHWFPQVPPDVPRPAVGNPANPPGG